MRPRISQKDNQIFTVWQQYKDDARKEVELTISSTNFNELENKPKKPKVFVSEGQKRKKLMTTLNKYWNAILNKDYKTVYMMHDPFFRKRIDFDMYNSKTGSIKYNKFKIDEVIIHGNEASIKATINYEVPRLDIAGKETSMPPKDAPIEDVWLYLDGTWQRKYVDAMTGASAINY
jgi:hypothetical protein